MERVLREFQKYGYIDIAAKDMSQLVTMSVMQNSSAFYNNIDTLINHYTPMISDPESLVGIVTTGNNNYIALNFRADVAGQNNKRWISYIYYLKALSNEDSRDTIEELLSDINEQYLDSVLYRIYALSNKPK